MSELAAVIGSFDGVHLGHVALIQAMLKESNERNLEPLAITFDPPPALYFNPHFNFLLTTGKEKEELIRAQGINKVICLDFASVVNLDPERFIAEELCSRSVRLVCVGEGFRFGKDRKGNVELLKKIACKEGLEVKTIHKKRLEGEAVSATRIRELLLLGDIARANMLLGYEYGLEGGLRKGLGRAGAILGTPTVNIEPTDPAKLIPPDGIYAVRFGESRHPGVCYIGSSPTFGDSTHKIEVHLVESSPNQETITVVRFVARLRPDRKFDSIEELRGQVQRDIENARRLLSLR